jgi:hypothetical protein
MVWNFFSLDDVEQAMIPDSALGVVTPRSGVAASKSGSPKHKSVNDEEEPENLWNVIMNVIVHHCTKQLKMP